VREKLGGTSVIFISQSALAFCFGGWMLLQTSYASFTFLLWAYYFPRRVMLLLAKRSMSSLWFINDEERLIF